LVDEEEGGMENDDEMEVVVLLKDAEDTTP